MSSHGIFFQVYRQITSGEVQLPGLPDVALKVRRAIQDESNDLATVVRILQVDPNLSAHLMRVANTPLYRTRVPAEDLASAVRRFGLEGTLNIVTSYILKGLFHSRSQAVRKLLGDVWKRSVKVASISAVLARHCEGFDPDSAMLAGLLQDIGALPLLGEIERRGEGGLEVIPVSQVLDDFSAQVGALLLEHWELDERFVEVARRRNAYDHDADAPADLADLVQVARLQSFAGETEALDLPSPDQVTAYAKLPLGELTEDMTLVVLDESADDIEQVRQVLAG